LQPVNDFSQGLQGHAERVAAVAAPAGLEIKIATKVFAAVVTCRAVHPARGKVLRRCRRANLAIGWNARRQVVTVGALQPLPGSMFGVTEGIAI